MNYITSHTVADYHYYHYESRKIAEKLDREWKKHETDAFQIDENFFIIQKWHWQVSSVLFFIFSKPT